MANYSNLKAAIADVIKTNGTQAITGQVLQDVLNSIVSVIGANYTFAGVATPSTNPGTPDQNVFYLASKAGLYVNFGNVQITKSMTVFLWNGSWSHQTLFELSEDINYIELAQVIFDKSNIITPIAISIVNNSYFNTNGTIGSDNRLSIYEYEVQEGEIYAFSSFGSSGYSALPIIGWTDENNDFLACEDYNLRDTGYNKQVIVVPSGARYMWFNVRPIRSSSGVVQMDSIYKASTLFIDEDIRQLIAQNQSYISNYTELTPTVYADNSLFLKTGTVRTLSSFRIDEYQVTGGNTYLFSARNSNSVTNVFLAWLDSSRNIIKIEDYGGTGVRVIDKAVVAPQGASYAWMNMQKSYSASNFNMKSISVIQSRTLDSRITVLENSLQSNNKLMKVVIIAEDVAAESTMFYIRSKYNQNKDIILTNVENLNTLISYGSAYIGDNSLTDEQLMTSTYLISNHTDSTAPLFNVTQYWHLFAQHGYSIPYISNSVGMTSDDIGAVWKDQLNRQFTIGKVTDSYIYLLPVIYQDADGHYVRDWKNKSYSTGISELTHVSGGVFTTTFSVGTNYQEQLGPIMIHSDREFYVDGGKVGAGSYYCDMFNVSESQIGYDPATVQDWFGGEDGNPNLNGALPMAKFTMSYNYCGAQCCVNTTIEILREVECQGYGAIQQQFFYDKGEYKAMFMIPKAKPYGGVEIDKPFNSPNSSGSSKIIYRTSNYLKDVNDPVDRQIGMLHNPNDGTYLVGMAAGLSLISGDTVKEKRIQNCLVGSNDHYRLLNFSPSNTNKFYIMAFNTSPYAANDYYLPTTLFKEIDYYVCYFDPAENIGQVYWYKDGSNYVIYCHCQSIQNRLAINVSKIMEGRKLSVIEKTSNAELLSDTIANGKFFVSYNTADANYIVLKAE